jgi:hypothetical protein
MLTKLSDKSDIFWKHYNGLWKRYNDLLKRCNGLLNRYTISRMKNDQQGDDTPCWLLMRHNNMVVFELILWRTCLNVRPARGPESNFVHKLTLNLWIG